MGKTARDAAILAGVEGAIILGSWAMRNLGVKLKLPAEKGEAILQGKIEDSEQLLPIPYATIKLNGLTCHADENGQYQIIEIPPGTYQVTASAEGYHPRTITVTIKEPTTFTRDFVIEPFTPLAYVAAA